MTSAVEAKSLSALTILASNPPRYPRNPTHERHEPLVLYIERVPGSKGGRRVLRAASSFACRYADVKKMSS